MPLTGVTGAGTHGVPDLTHSGGQGRVQSAQQGLGAAVEQTQGWEGKGWSRSRLEEQLCPQPRGVLTTPGAQSTPNSAAGRRNHTTGTPGAAREEGQSVAEGVTAHKINGIWKWNWSCAVHNKHLKQNKSN